MPLKVPAYVKDLLNVDPAATVAIAEFCAEHNQRVAERAESERETPRTAFREVSHEELKRETDIEAAPEGSSQRRDLEFVREIDKHEPLPEPAELRKAQEEISGFIESFDPRDHDPLADERPLRAGTTWWNMVLADSQPVLELTDDGFLRLVHQVRDQSKREGNGYLARAWLELAVANVLDRTQARIARARTRKEAEEIAAEFYDRYRGMIERRVVRDHRAGRSASELARQYDLPRGTVRSILKRAGADPP